MIDADELRATREPETTQILRQVERTPYGVREADLDLEKTRHEIEKIVETGPDVRTSGQLPFTPVAKKVLELSMGESSNLSHNYIGTEHLLLGLIKEKNGIAAQVLKNLGVKLDAVREEVLEFLGESDAQDP